MRDVIPKLLWIGNAKDARDVKAVLGLEISAVVDLAMEEPPIQFPRDVAYCRFPLIDGDGNTPAMIQAAIDTTVSFIRGGVPTLVTCDGGMSRSPAIAAAALAIIEGMTPEQALERVAATGPHDVSVTFWTEVRDARKRIKHICGVPYPLPILVVVWGIVGGLTLAFIINFMPPLYFLIASGIVGLLIGITFGLALRRWPPSRP